MACSVDPGMSVLVGSNNLANWATDFVSVVGRGGSNKAGEGEDILGTIAGSGGGGCTVASTQGGRQQQLTKPPPPPLLALRRSLVWDVMARLSLSLFLSLSLLSSLE